MTTRCRGCGAPIRRETHARCRCGQPIVDARRQVWLSAAGICGALTVFVWPLRETVLEPLIGLLW